MHDFRHGHLAEGDASVLQMSHVLARQTMLDGSEHSRYVTPE